MKITESLQLRARLLPDATGKMIGEAMRPKSAQPNVSRFERGGVKYVTEDWFDRYWKALLKLGADPAQCTLEAIKRAHAKTVGIRYRKPQDPSRLGRAA